MSFSELRKLPIYEIFGRPKKIADVGIELEIEGVGLPATVPHWQVKPEGSLHDGGLEYITKPIKADVVKNYVDTLRLYITNSGGSIKNTYRCSTHIHVNMLTESMEDTLGFIVVFTMFEPLFLSLCGSQRDGNLFCLSSYDTGDTISSFESLCKSLNYVKTVGWSFERGKYAALNTGRLTDLGTLEVRCFPLSVEGAVVSEWVDWLLRIKDIVRSEQDKTFRSLWKNVRQNPMWYAQIIFGARILSTSSSSLIDFGTEGAYELTKILKKWHLHPAPEKESKKKKIFTHSADSYAPYQADILTQAWGGTPTLITPVPGTDEVEF